MATSPARRQRRAKANGKVPEATSPVTTPVDEPQETSEASSEMSNPAVLVIRAPGANPGELNIQIMEINGLDPLAVPTLLRAAANIKENHLNAGGK